ncbi:MAG: lysozyme [Betaproteobacteria bacterium]|nr:lysozyme [Betaproteobacteria bacterium]
MQAAATLALSDADLGLLRAIEQLRLAPYDDQTGQPISAWLPGATIGYGHLIGRDEWPRYAGGITPAEADALLAQDVQPSEQAVRSAIQVRLLQRQFDALVLLAFNIGAAAFAGSSVVRLINDPRAKTPYRNLQAAWSAWSRSQGRVLQGLVRRRQAEWAVYTRGVYAW